MSSARTRQQRRLATLALLVATMIFGASFVVLKTAVSSMSVADFLSQRFLLAAAVLFLIKPRALFGLSGRMWLLGAALGFLYGTSQLIQGWGLQHTSAVVSAFVTGMYVVFTPVFAALFLRIKINSNAWYAVAISVAGLSVLTLNGVSAGSGEMLTLLSAALCAAHILVIAGYVRPGEAYSITVIQMLVVGIMCLPLAAWNGLQLPTGHIWLALLYAAVCSGAISLFLQTWGQARVSATRAAVIMTIEPVFAALTAVVFASQEMSIRIILGGALIVAAMYVVELKPRKQRVVQAVEI